MPSLQDFLGEPTVENYEERTDEDRAAESVGIDSDVRYCACGCGKALGNVHGNAKYLSGHKLGSVKIPKDPDRPAKPKSDVPAFPGDKIPASVKKDIEEKLAFFLGLGGLAWEAKDPICGAEFSDRTDQIATKLVPLVVKNKFLFKFFSSDTQLGTAIELAIILKPIATSVVKHHILKSIGHEEELENLPNQSLIYPVR